MKFRLIEIKNSIQLEKRTIELGKHETGYSEIKRIIEKYKNIIDTIYISFTQINKIGINPQSEYNTPLGIYCYPLSEFKVKFIYKDETKLKEIFPFASENPYIKIIQENPNANIIKNLSTYNSKNFDDDLEKLRKYFTNNNSFDETVKEGINSAKSHFIFCKIWNITRLLSLEIPKKIRINRNDIKIVDTVVYWNFILNKVLGWGGVVDNEGLGIIHEAEKIQAVFFNIKVFKHLETLLNHEPRRRIDVKFKDGLNMKILISQFSWMYKIVSDGEISAAIIGIENNKICWYDGIWENEIWRDGIWKDGTWGNGIWKDGIWKNGTWEDGIWEDGTWLSGTWGGGRWKGGKWEGGTWLSGYDANGIFHGENDSPDKWKK